MSSPAFSTETSAQLTCFLLAGDLYAIDIMRIKEIIQAQRIRPVPQAPRYIQGVINLRGTVIPVVDLRQRFGIAKAEDLGLAQRVIITSVSGRIVGLQVDAVTEILKLRNEQIVRVPSLINRRETAYVLGIAISDENMVLILNMDRILSSEEAIDMERVRKAAFESADLEAPHSDTPESPKAPEHDPDTDARELAEYMLRDEETVQLAATSGEEPAPDWIDEATSIDENSQVVNREKKAQELAESLIEADEPAAVAGAGSSEKSADMDGAGPEQGGRDETEVSVSRALSKRKKTKSKKAKKPKKAGNRKKTTKKAARKSAKKSK